MEYFEGIFLVFQVVLGVFLGVSGGFEGTFWYFRWVLGCFWADQVVLMEVTP